jgi:nitrogen fixation NifU-like protein
MQEMPALDSLYQEVILDHYKHPRNKGALDKANHDAEGYNPLCGDRLHVYLIVDNDVVKDVRFEAAGCAISVASASLMSEAVKGKTVAQVRELFERFQQVVRGEREPGPDLGKLAVFAGVAKYPVRVKCATLAWHTVQAAFRDEKQPVTTERSDE